MNINWVFLFISIIISACFTTSAANSLLSQVATFEYAVFRYATSDGGCTAFYKTVGGDEESGRSAQQTQDYICERYTNTVNCWKYLSANSKISQGDLETAQKDFNDNNVSELVALCGNKK